MRILGVNKEVGIKSPVVTMGVFDGVHRGHLDLIREVRAKASELSGESVLVTFSPHPRIVLNGGKTDLSFLTSIEEKQTLIEKAGIDNLIVIPFTRELSRLSACEFLKEYIVNRLGVMHLVMGFNHRFGYRGEGNHETVSRCGEKYGFGVSLAKAKTENDKAISSTLIRELLLNGSLSEANKLLGYQYSIAGKVIPGKKIGSAMGYPTANIKPDYPYKLIPAKGVYAVKVIAGGTEYKGMLYIGNRPTIEGKDRNLAIEVNIFGFSGNLYGEKLTVVFKHFMREDIKFDNMESLYRQITMDKEETLRLLD